MAGLWGHERSGSPITVAGPQPICTAFPFAPDFRVGVTLETEFSKNSNRELRYHHRPRVSTETMPQVVG